MFKDENDKVEQPALQQLQKLGWTYVSGVELAPLASAEDSPNRRDYLRDVVLANRLEASLRKLNPWISEENLRKVMREITHPIHAGLMEYNHAIYQKLVNYLSVDQDLGKGRKAQTVRIIDFDEPSNNDFLCTNQVKYEGPHQNIFPDIVCYVNGLPLAVIECKSPYLSTVPVADGIDQLRRYANLRDPASEEGMSKLFWYNQLMISTCRDQCLVGTISSLSQHYSEWKDAWPMNDEDILASLTPIETNQVSDHPAPEYTSNNSLNQTEATEHKITPQARLLAGMFSPATFLDLIQNFTLYETVDGRLIKKVARYQQYRAVNKVIDRLHSADTRKDKSGVIWHTQGSGKSLTMVMLAVKMRRDPELQQYKLIFITDRNQLDQQLSATFREAQSETIKNANSVNELRELLRSDTSDIVTATVQKFRDAEAEAASEDPNKSFTDLNTSDKVIVLADEAHRTQFGNLAATITAALPNAPRIGFTGTPLLESQKMDQAFGGYIDQYKINEAVDDGATIPIIYEGRQVETDVVGDSLDALFDEYFHDYSDEDKREIRKKYGVERAVREAPARIRWVCIDLLKHYRSKIQPEGFKAMIVVGSRHAATVYKKTLDELEAPPSEVIISGKHNEEAYIAQYTDKAHQTKVIKEFTKPLSENPTTFLIVKDMLLTGFDAPILQVMYIDRNLKDHTLMQAIARVNRTYKDKQRGYVMDYFGLSTQLNDALKAYSSDDIEGAYYTLKDEIPKLKAAHTRVAALFSSVKTRSVDDYVLTLKSEERRQLFDMAYKQFARQMEVVLPDIAAKPFVPDLTFWGKVQNSARTIYRDPQLNLKDVSEKVRRLVDEHIISTGVDPKIPPIDLMAHNFKESLEKASSPESKASEIESAIKHHITVNLDEDPEYYKSLSLRLKEIIEQTNGKWEQQVQLLLQLRDGLETEREQAAEELGLSDTEFSFYNILMSELAPEDDTMIAESQHTQVKAITQGLVSLFEEATHIVDFFAKPDEVKRLRKAVKRTLIEHHMDDRAVINSVQDRFLELARKKFG
ncbi:type I restriction endonuclease subunit R [Pseudohongiella nitratireducens]|uniref:type I restriction endonuclease subunit R n=1 Tax=Pseudohongiella nitratireducens TaxID=1768907 RepID=UPI0030ECE12A|tara:strand:- start:981 stop:4085 length:3105 start_codon:yes stop_codon:yes gene_type:complete